MGPYATSYRSAFNDVSKTWRVRLCKLLEEEQRVAVELQTLPQGEEQNHSIRFSDYGLELPKPLVPEQIPGWSLNLGWLRLQTPINVLLHIMHTTALTCSLTKSNLLSSHPFHRWFNYCKNITTSEITKRFFPNILFPSPPPTHPCVTVLTVDFVVRIQCCL